MTKLELLYVKIDAFWESIPSPIKVPIYQLVSAGILLLADTLTGKAITKDMWGAILSAFIANEAAVVVEYVRKQSEKLEELKIEYNRTLLDR